MSYPRILVVTSCTGEKCFKPETPLTLEDFQDEKRLKEREAALSEFAKPAAQMYTGRQHLFVMEGVRILRETFGKDIVDVAILSAGYGLISEDRSIVPYEVTFRTMKVAEIDRWSHFLGIQRDFEEKVRGYDLVFILLGEDYLRALSLSVKTSKKQTLVFLASNRSKRYISVEEAKTIVLPLSNQEAKQFRCGLVALKGFLFQGFAKKAAKQQDWLQQVCDRPHILTTYFIQSSEIQLELPINISPKKTSKKKKSQKKFKQYAKDEVIPIPENIPVAANWNLEMKYFIPDWDDRVDPNYDFLTDTLTANRDSYSDDVYAHEIYRNRPNYDGVLVSKIVVEKNKKNKAYLDRIGIHKFLRFKGEIMGDCGAFGYIKQETPPFETNEILDYYHRLGFDYGVSIDHLIVGPFAEPGIREMRYELTLDNAFDFIQGHQQNHYKFTPIAAVQGWSPESYASAVSKVIKMGYSYIALGGLARAQTGEILEILKAVSPCLKPDTRLHLFGVARLNAIAAFRHLGVTSFDSAAPLRKAWLDSDENYHTKEKQYAAVRLPEVKKSNLRIKRIVEAGIADLETLAALEAEAIEAMRQFDVGNLSVEATLEKILAYDDLLELPRKGKVKPEHQARRHAKHESLYRELLLEQPWKKCDCEICQEIGVEVVIFRNNNRNRRRGFHNTYVFYNQFIDLIQSLDRQHDLRKSLDEKVLESESQIAEESTRLCSITARIGS